MDPDEYEKWDEWNRFYRKVVFIDMDGTIADLNFDTHVKDIYEPGFFLNKKPSTTIINAIRNVFSDYDKIILSASPSTECSMEKIKWLEKWFPEIKPNDMIFINYPRENKIDKLLNICRFKNLDPRNVILIDDSLDILREGNSRGIKSIHPIRVLIMEENNERAN